MAAPEAPLYYQGVPRTSAAFRLLKQMVSLPCLFAFLLLASPVETSVVFLCFSTKMPMHRSTLMSARTRICSRGVSRNLPETTKPVKQKRGAMWQLYAYEGLCIAACQSKILMLGTVNVWLLVIKGTY
jgi:hypothetical protein